MMPPSTDTHIHSHTLRGEEKKKISEVFIQEGFEDPFANMPERKPSRSCCINQSGVNSSLAIGPKGDFQIHVGVECSLSSPIL